MSNREVTIIATLSAMLKTTSDNLEDAHSAHDILGERYADTLNELDSTKRELDIADAACANLQDRLEEERRHARTAFSMSGHASLFLHFVANPEKMMECISYLRDNHEFARTNKIAAIKEVRQRGHYGLKEAKDLVEAFFAAHPSADPNHCLYRPGY